MEKGKVKKIKLTQGKYAIVDTEDYVSLSKYKWHYCPAKYTGYARRNVGKRGNQKTVYMPALLLDCPKGMQIDHINRNGLDNRKSNLRIVTKEQNQHNLGMKSNNTSGYQGVTFNKRENKWISQKTINGKKIHIGKSSTLKGAVKLYKDFIDRNITNFFNKV